MTPRSRVIDPLLQRPLKMREALCATSEAHLLAQIIPPLATNATLATWYANLQGHAVAESKAPHLRADRNNNTRRLVAKGQGLASAEIAIGKLLEVGHI